MNHVTDLLDGADVDRTVGTQAMRWSPPEAGPRVDPPLTDDGRWL